MPKHPTKPFFFISWIGASSCSSACTAHFKSGKVARLVSDLPSRSPGKHLPVFVHGSNCAANPGRMVPSSVPSSCVASPHTKSQEHLDVPFRLKALGGPWRPHRLEPLPDRHSGKDRLHAKAHRAPSNLWQAQERLESFAELCRAVLSKRK